MAKFLSDDWIADLDRAARAAPGLAGIGAGAPLVIEQHVRLGDEEVVYSLRFDTHGARVDPGPASAPELVVLTDAATARALQQGTMNAQQAVVAGRLKLRGSIKRLRAVGEALQTLDDVFGEVRAATTDAEVPHGGGEERH